MKIENYGLRIIHNNNLRLYPKANSLPIHFNSRFSVSLQNSIGFFIFCSHQKQRLYRRQYKYHCMTGRMFWWKLSDFKFWGYFTYHGLCRSFVSARILYFLVFHFPSTRSANRENISTRIFESTKLRGWCLDKHQCQSLFCMFTLVMENKSACLDEHFFCSKVNYAPLFHLWYPALFFFSWFLFYFFLHVIKLKLALEWKKRKYK